MAAPHADQIIDGYLSRLEQEAEVLPAGRRHELIDGILEHIEEARAALPNETDADLLTILDRLGDPEDLVAEDEEAVSIEPVRVGLLEIAALVLTLLFWPVGVILLWASGAWRTRDKLIGTLVPPGGYFGLFFVLGAGGSLSVSGCTNRFTANGQTVSQTRSSSSDPAWFGVVVTMLLVLLFLSPILSSIYLAIQLRRASRAFSD